MVTDLLRVWAKIDTQRLHSVCGRSISDGMMARGLLRSAGDALAYAFHN